MEDSAHAGLPAVKEDEGWALPAPVRAEEAALVSSFEEGAVKALRASPDAEDATLLIIVLRVEVAGASASFEGSARPLPFGLLMLVIVKEIHGESSEV